MRGWYDHRLGGLGPAGQDSQVADISRRRVSKTRTIRTKAKAKREVDREQEHREITWSRSRSTTLAMTNIQDRIRDDRPRLALAELVPMQPSWPYGEPDS